MERGARSVNRHWAQLLLRLGPHVPSSPLIDDVPATSGSLTVSPAAGVAGEWGTWTLRYEVGDEPIEELGGLRVQLPEEWHAGIRNSAFRMQASHAREPNRVAARASRADVVLQTIVELESDVSLDKTGRLSNLSGRAGYYDYVTRVIVRRGRLERGEYLDLVFGDTTRGSAGFQAGVLACPPTPVLVAVDHGGSGRFRPHVQRPTLEILPGEPAELVVTARSDAVAGDTIPLRVALVDRWANAATSAADLHLEVVEGAADLPAKAVLPAGIGWVEIPATPRGAGVLRIRVRDGARALSAVSNPVVVHEARPERQVYWGDIHSHTHISADGLGSGREAYDYARHISCLDFYSRTDHASYFETGSPIADFEGYAALADKADHPGEFATVHGYELSFGSPYGHHNVYFRGRPALPGDEYTLTLPELWKALRGETALTIPHHTLKMPEVVDWTDTDDPDLRRNFEIFSAHGLSEAFDPAHPLAVEQSLFTNASTTQRRGTSAQRAWEDGLRLSTLASSDDHRAHPGMPHQGLIAVRAAALTREDVFDAMRERRTYATTGARILLEFTAGGIEMGGEGRSPRPVAIRASAVGTDVIEVVEVLRHVVGRPGFRVVASLRPQADRFDWDVTDDPGPGAAIYYVRLRQHGLVRGVVAMAWSSPVWITAAGPAPSSASASASAAGDPMGDE